MNRPNGTRIGIRQFLLTAQLTARLRDRLTARLTVSHAAVIVAGIVALAVAPVLSQPAGAAGSGQGSSLYGVPITNIYGYKYGYAAAKAELPALYAGTSTSVNTTPRPGAKHKFVVIISSGQANPSSSIPADGAAAAAAALGWKATILDGQLNPSIWGNLVDQAIGMGANGIILVAVDCDQVKGPLQEARAKHIAVVGVLSYDCSDPSEHSGPSLFNAYINYNNTANKNIGGFAEEYGRAQADYVIAKSSNKARVLVLNDLEYTVLKYTGAGFVDQINHSGGSKVVEQLNFVSTDLGPKLQQMIQGALLAHPNINWIKSPFAFATVLGIVPAIASYPQGRYEVMGGEGLQPELQDIQTGSVTAAMSIDNTWSGWAAVDAMNSVFQHIPTYPSGIGWELSDSTHNLPSNGVLVAKQNFEAAYEKAWGVKK